MQTVRTMVATVSICQRLYPRAAPGADKVSIFCFSTHTGPPAIRISNNRMPGSVCSQRLTLSRLNGRAAGSPPPSRGGEYFRVLPQRSLFHPPIRAVPGFTLLYRVMCGGHCTPLQWWAPPHFTGDRRHPPLACELLVFPCQNVTLSFLRL